MLGTLPVQGNGPNSINDLQRSARLRSDAQLSTSTYDSPAPSPRISRLRSMSLGRPSTAPGGGSARPKSSSGRGTRDSSKIQPFMAPKKRLGPPYLIGVTGPDNDDEDEDGSNYPEEERSVKADAPPPVPRIADHFKQAPMSPGLYSLKNNASSTRMANGGPGSIKDSIISGGGNSTKPGGHVDILDAQGALKPSDFRTRIQATGARDYGEDVADRNLGVNGVNLNSPAVLAFYALTGGEALAYKSDGSAVDVHGNKYTPGNIPVHLMSPASTTKDEIVAQANQSMRVPRFPTRTTSLEPREEVSRSSTRGYLAAATEDISNAPDSNFDSATARRRMSVQGSVLASSNPQPKPRPLSMHPVAFSGLHYEETEASAAAIPDIPRSRPTTSGDTPDTQSLSKAQQRARDSMLVTRKQRGSDNRSRSKGARSLRSNTQSQGRDTDSEGDEVYTRQRSHTSATSKSRKREKSRGHEFSLSYYGVLADEDDIPPLPAISSRPGSSGRHDSRPPSQRSWKAPSIGQLSASTVTTTPAEAGTPPVSRPSSSSSHPQNRSIGGSSARSRPHLHDITEHIPNRRSSLSISSIPSSSLSSNPFPRSQSRHTADTSLDLGYILPTRDDNPTSSNTRGHVRGKGSGGTMASSIRPTGYQEQRAEAPITGGTGMSSVDNYDEYMTTTTDGSDIDSYLQKRRPKRRDGEGLLFKEGAYGIAGSGLPGIFNDDNDNEDEPHYNQRPSTAAPIWSSSRRLTDSDYKQPHTTTSRPQTAVSATTNSRPPPPIPSWDFPVSKVSKSSMSSSKYSFQRYNADFDDSSSLTVSESDIDRASQADRHPYTNKSSILSGDSAYDDTEQEMDGQLDAKLAVRLRKEMKRRERAMTTSSARHKSMGKRPAWERAEQAPIAQLNSQ